MKQPPYTLVDSTSMVRVTTLSKEERELTNHASRLLGLRKSEFYRRAIIEKAQSVLSSSNKESQKEASPAIDVDGASFLSGGEK